MINDALKIGLSDVDEERFGIRTARASQVSAENLPTVLDFCHSNDVGLLIVRCPAADVKAAHAMEREGFRLMDVLVYFARDLVKTPLPADTGRIPVRPFRRGEEDQIKEVASEAFHDYYGHYHADERLDREKCDEGYVSWAYRSCVVEGVVDQVLVAELDGKIVGFGTYRLNNSTEGDFVLCGVAPSAQGFGVYRSFVIRGAEWCLSRGATRMVISTQITNIAVQKVWTRVGFEPSHSFLTFHRWFD